MELFHQVREKNIPLWKQTDYNYTFKYKSRFKKKKQPVIYINTPMQILLYFLAGNAYSRIINIQFLVYFTYWTSTIMWKIV